MYEKKLRKESGTEKNKEEDENNKCDSDRYTMRQMDRQRWTDRQHIDTQIEAERDRKSERDEDK